MTDKKKKTTMELGEETHAQLEAIRDARGRSPTVVVLRGLIREAHERLERGRVDALVAAASFALELMGNVYEHFPYESRLDYAIETLSGALAPFTQGDE